MEKENNEEITEEEKIEIYYSEVNEKLFNLFTKEFSKRGLSLESSFDYNVWFLNQYSKTSSLNNFKEIISSTPSETDDIIKHIIVKSFMRCKNNQFKILVESFINEITELLIHLHKEIKRINRLIKKYNAYETVNSIEQILNNFDKIVFNNEGTKSIMKFFIRNTENFVKGDYKLSILAGFLNTNNNIDILEYKLNNVLRVIESNGTTKHSDTELQFKPIEFFSFETSVKNVNDSGTNFSYFFIKCENLNYSGSKPFFSPQKRVLEVFLSNMKIILNNYKKNKILETGLEFEYQDELVGIDLGILIELDPMTCSTIYSKIILLLKELISYKVQTHHKWKTVLNYFEGVSEEILLSFLNSKSSKKKEAFNYYDIENEVFKLSDDEVEKKLKDNKEEKEDDKKSCLIF